ncbi:MAG TPA: hypothetical protein VGM56_00095, partial [Byssovorax sp.]|jgi:hypothetical protein
VLDEGAGGSPKPAAPFTLVGWAPTPDGGVVALATSTPSRLDPAERAHQAAAVRVVELGRVPDGLALRPQADAVRYLGAADARLHARVDGVDVWLHRSNVAEAGGHVPALAHADGRVELLALPRSAVASIGGGDFGLAEAGDGALFQTTDHGRSYRAVGRAPVPPSALEGSCSALGCRLGAVVRVGWGDERAGGSIDVGAARSARESAPTLTLRCRPTGLFEPRPRSADEVRRASAGERERSRTLRLPSGANLTLRDAQPEPPTSSDDAATPPVAARAARPRASTSSTHVVWARRPFHPAEPERALELRAPGFDVNRTSAAVPLISARDDVAWYVVGDAIELVVGAARVENAWTVAPVQGGYVTLAVRDGARVTLLDARIPRLELADRAIGAPPPTPPSPPIAPGGRRFAPQIAAAPREAPISIGFDRELLAQHRYVTVGVRRDGARGVVVLDGAGLAAVAPIELGALGPLEGLAPLSLAAPSSSAACRASDGYRVVVPLRELRGVEIEGLPRVKPRRDGLVLVTWSKQRPCVEAIEIVVGDAPRDLSVDATLAARWNGAPSGELATADGALPLACDVAGDAELDR